MLRILRRNQCQGLMATTRDNHAPPPQTDTARGPFHSLSVHPQGAQILGFESITHDNIVTISVGGHHAALTCSASAGPLGALNQDPVFPTHINTAF